MKNRITLYSTLIFLTIALIACEVYLRHFLGLTHALLIRSDKDFEYIAQPNQNTIRFGNRIVSNEFSMRSQPVRQNAIKLLGLGDSVINGGSQVDQDSLTTTRLSIMLSQLLGDPVQVLNISAKSWGPDNCAAYLKKYGLFNAKAMIMVVNSHDAQDTMTFKKIVGVDKNYPEKQYNLALAELIDVYVWPRVAEYFSADEPENYRSVRKAHYGNLNVGFSKILAYSRQYNIPLIIYLHPTIDELRAGHYDAEGRQIIKFSTDNGIRLIKGLQLGLTDDCYIDYIHLNNRGQRKMSEIIFRAIKDDAQMVASISH